MLIMGAFFAVAALAFLVGLWLAYTEQQEMLAMAASTSEKKIADVVTVAKTPVLVMEQVAREKALMNPALQIPVVNETRLAAVREPRTRVSSGQLRELALELRSLQMQAGEINARLLLLSTMVEVQIEEMVVSPVEFREGLAV